MTGEALTGTDPAYWPCGYCYAPRGEVCRTLTGQRRRTLSPHRDRMKSVELFERYGNSPAVQAGITAVQAEGSAWNDPAVRAAVRQAIAGAE